MSGVRTKIRAWQQTLPACQRAPQQCVVISDVRVEAWNGPVSGEIARQAQVSDSLLWAAGMAYQASAVTQ